MGSVITIIILIAVAIGISAWYKNKLISDGKMIERDNDFVEYAEIFTLKSVPFTEMAEIIKAADFKKKAHADYSGRAGDLKLSTGSYYEARLVCTEHTEAKMTYRFEFTNWQSSHGRPQFVNEMNVLMTTVEKMFLGIDPDTQVAKVKNDIQTKRSLF